MDIHWYTVAYPSVITTVVSDECYHQWYGLLPCTAVLSGNPYWCICQCPHHLLHPVWVPQAAAAYACNTAYCSVSKHGVWWDGGEAVACVLCVSLSGVEREAGDWLSTITVIRMDDVASALSRGSVWPVLWHHSQNQPLDWSNCAQLASFI